MYIQASTFKQAVMLIISEMEYVTDKRMITAFYPLHTIEVVYATRFNQTRAATYYQPEEGEIETEVYSAKLISENDTRDISEYFEL